MDQLKPQHIQRPMPTAWREAPNDMRELGFKGMMVMHIPVRKEWGEAQRARVAQAIGDTILKRLLELEAEGDGLWMPGAGGQG